MTNLSDTLAALKKQLAARDAAIADVQELIDSTTDASHAVACVRWRLRQIKQPEADKLVASLNELPSTYEPYNAQDAELFCAALASRGGRIVFDNQEPRP